MDNIPQDRRPLSSRVPHLINGRFLNPGDKKPPALTRLEGKVIFVGTIESVNTDKLTMNIVLRNKEGYVENVPLCFPYLGSMGMVGAMPEVGASVVLAKEYATDSKYPSFKFFPLAYLPANLILSPDYVAIQNFPDSVGNQDKNIFFSKFRELRKGEILVGSGDGSEIFLDKDVEIHSVSGSTLLLRSGDQSILATSLNNFMFSDGIWRSAGLIQRNSLSTKNQKDEPIFGLNAEQVVTEDGRKVVYIKPENTDLSYGNKIYSEYRLEVDEYGNRLPQSNDINAVLNTTARNPTCIFSMGNYVGNNKKDERAYGHLLGVRFFDTYKSEKGSFQLYPLSTAGGVDQPAIMGLAYAIHTPKNNAFIGIDKEGHNYQFFPASSPANPLGAGRSISVLAHGNKKEIYGSAHDGNSWDLAAKGGVRWRLGKHNDLGGGFSIDVRTKGSAYFEYGVPDQQALEDIRTKEPQKLKSLDGYGKIERVVGNSRYDIEGSREVRIEGSDSLKINGLQEYEFTSYKQTIGSAKSTNVGDSYSITVLKEMNGKFGSRTTTILAGSDDLTVIAGNITRKINSVGNVSTSTGTGNITEDILVAGNRTFTSKLGNYSVECGAGNIEVMTKAGKVIIETKAGTVKVSGPAGVDIISLAKVSLNGATVDIGSGAVKGGVVTTLTHLDYIVGIPLQGSFTVKASN